MFQGIYTAIITPFRGGKVDKKKLEELVTYQVEAGVQGIVACGSTGEFLYLSKEEQKQVIEICVKHCKGKAQVIAGAAALCPQETLTLIHQAEKAGVDGILIVSPWYIKPSQNSLYTYYKTIAENVGLPIIVYNNPTRTGVDISFNTLVRLAELKNIKGLKEASSNLSRITQLKCCLGDTLSLLTGNDDPFAGFLAMGGDGGIMTASNVVPDLFVALMKAWDKADLPQFRKSWEKVFPLISALGLECNPGPIKYAMTLVQGVSPGLRLPFEPLKVATQEAIKQALKDLGLLKPLSIVGQG